MTSAADRPLAAIGIRLAATALLSVMFAIAKIVQQNGVNLVEVLFFRQALASVTVFAIVVLGPGIASLRTKRPGMHASRAGVGLFSMGLNFATVAMLPLAETQTLWFTTPLFATLLSALVLGEAVGRHRWAAVVAGFIGVLIVVQPQSGHMPLVGALVGLAAGLGTGIVTILLRQLGSTERALTTVFWFGAMSTVPLALVLPWFAGSHDLWLWGLLLAMGVIGALGQVALTVSLQLAPVSTVAPVDYASLIWSMLLGIWLFAEVPTGWTWIGAPIVVASGLYIVWREHRRRITNVLAATAVEA